MTTSWPASGEILWLRERVWRSGYAATRACGWAGIGRDTLSSLIDCRSFPCLVGEPFGGAHLTVKALSAQYLARGD